MKDYPTVKCLVAGAKTIRDNLVAPTLDEERLLLLCEGIKPKLAFARLPMPTFERFDVVRG
jgi:hypothetical protein